MSVTVFLSGAMDYVGEYAISWRKEATFMLTQRGYSVYDPTSIPEDRDMSPEEVARKNIFMQERSDLILVEYMIEDRAYIGTDFELSWAKIHGQPAVVFCHPKHKDRVYMKYMATKLADTLQDAIEYIAIHYPTK
jgi:hypothetical protein